MAKKPASTALAVKEEAPVPDFLANFDGATGLEHFTKEDFKLPRIKLLQALSPEVKENPGVAFPGQFWSTATKEPIGEEFEFIIASATRRVSLWAPRKSGGGRLAYAKDAIHWDKPNHEFALTIPNIGKVTYNTKGTVQESKLLEWGSSNPNDPNSQPAATLSYDYLIHVLSGGGFSPIVFSLYRTGVDTAKDFLTMLAATRRPIQGIKCIARVREVTKNEDSYYAWQFKLNGLLGDEHTFSHVRGLADMYKDYEAEEEKPESSNTIDVSAVTDI